MMFYLSNVTAIQIRIAVEAGFKVERFQRWLAWKMENPHLGGGFKHFVFSHLLVEDFQFDSYFSNGLKPPARPSFDGIHFENLWIFGFSMAIC